MMKRFLLLWAAATAMLTAAAQEVLLEEEFENGIPESWTNIDFDGDYFNWKTESENVKGHRGYDKCAYSESYTRVTNEPLYPDNWLVTPQLTLNGNCKLTYFVAPQDPNFAAEHYGVFLSETGTGVANFTTLLFEETLPLATEGFSVRVIDLSRFAGKNVYLAFRHFNVSEKYILKIDGVKVESKEATGVSDIAVAEPESNVWYDLQGRKFEQKPEAAGIYISNGKKVVVR